MPPPRFGTRGFIGAMTAVVLGLGVWQISVVMAAAPAPNPLAPSPNPQIAPIAGVDITGAGPASKIHGDPTVGATKFATICNSCHGEQGANGITNPCSDDGSVPTLNPIDPGFGEDSNGDAAVFARELDLFLQ